VWNGGPAKPHGEPLVWIAVPVRTVSEGNSREHFRVVRARKVAQRRALSEALTVAGERVVEVAESGGPWCVRLTRQSPAVLDDDNLTSALKAIRDTVAAALHVSDGDARIAWTYAQIKGVAAVMVEIWGPGSVP
jgi:hypothetical protein